MSIPPIHVCCVSVIRTLVVLLLWWMVTECAWAQNAWEEDVIYLKNGSVLRGEITRQEAGKSVTLTLIDGTTFTFATTAIEKITRETSRFSHIKLRYTREHKPFVYQKQGVYHYLSLGFAFNQNRWGSLDLNPSIQYRMAYHFHPLLNVGVGTALDTYEGGVIMPAMLTLNGDLFRKPVTPHYTLDLGYGFGLSGTPNHFQFQGGPMGHAGVGLKFHTTKRKEWIITVGYRGQHTYQEFREWPGGWWDPWRGTTEPVVVKGTRFYQKIVWQFSVGF